MGVVDLDEEVGHGQLQLVGPQPPCRIARGQAQPPTEEEKDVRRLSDDLPAGAQERRRERRAFEVLVVQDPGHRRHAAAAGLGLQGHVDVVGRGFLERQADEFAAPLDAGPVVELVAHAGVLFA
jgi:hypothetical protein